MPSKRIDKNAALHNLYLRALVGRIIYADDDQPIAA
jgi:hypothetical protein